MKSFAFNFRAGTDENRSLSDTFSFEPESIYEKKSGNLYMIGLLNNSLPKDQAFLSDLATQIKNAHYNSKHKTVERSLNDSLQDANLYLEKLIKSDQVGWMGNLNFAVFALRNRDFYFAKTGLISIFLLRDGAIVDLEQDLNEASAQPQLQVFGNLVSGKLQDGDAILAATSTIGAFIKKQKIIKEIADIASPTKNQNFDLGRLERAFETHKLRMSSLEGSCLLISLRADLSESAVRDFKPDESIKKVSLREMFSSQKSPISAPNITHASFGKNRGFPWAKLVAGSVALVALASGGYLYYWVHKTQAVAAAKEQIQIVAGKIATVSTLKGSGQAQQAKDLLDSSVAELETIERTSAGFLPQIKSQIAGVQSSIDSATMALNGSQIVSPTVVFRFTDIQPSKIALNGGEILVFDQKLKGIYSITNGSAKRVDAAGSFDLAASGTGEVIFFTKPNVITEYKNGAFLQPIKLGLPYANANYDDMGCFSGNLYFIDRAPGAMIKYLRLNKSYSLPQSWLAGGLKIASNEVSLAFDRNAWILNSDGSIDKYFAGSLETTLKPTYAPAPQKVLKIASSAQLQNLYILDSDSGRIIILSKTGQLIKQLDSNQFKGALDLAVSDGGQQILVLTPGQLLQIAP